MDGDQGRFRAAGETRCCASLRHESWRWTQEEGVEFVRGGFVRPEAGSDVVADESHRRRARASDVAIDE